MYNKIKVKILLTAPAQSINGHQHLGPFVWTGLVINDYFVAKHFNTYCNLEDGTTAHAVMKYDRVYELKL